jgi:hypothetical protein
LNGASYVDMRLFFLEFGGILKSSIFKSLSAGKTYEEFVHCLKLCFQTLRVDLECILMVLIELHSRLNDILEPVIGH